MRSLRTEDEIIANWKGDIDKPVVSICCITYNHEPYIEDALEGFLIQETDFPFEILIHDDASTDRTADIIREYEAKYPRLIKPIYQIENQYSKGRRGFMNDLFSISKGKYIATCEGDDYWKDRQKLNIQVLFLDKNKSFVASGHDSDIIDENGLLKSSSRLKNNFKKDVSALKMRYGAMPFYLNCLVFRNVLEYKHIDEIKEITNGDVFLSSRLGKFGGYHYHKEICNSVYRFHEGGVWSMISLNKQASLGMQSFFWISKYYSRKEENNLSEAFAIKAAQVIISESGYISLKSIFALNKSLFKYYLRTKFPTIYFKLKRSIANKK
ncbi:MAG: glycosyl transferase family 2 [Cytophagales bacterium CG17_big_fil_post_rev_8_21_14_2_50_40_13]|nr:MAG: glycosyl transferase family 2 [Cytophagales bacterium CG17_big_fil_post_rev_8_21_14_2_50_40_13]